MDNNGYLDNSEHPLLDLDDSLHVLSLKPSTGGMNANETIMGSDSRGGVIRHVTSESQVNNCSLVTGQRELASQTRTQFSNWQGFLKFCDDLL